MSVDRREYFRSYDAQRRERRKAYDVNKRIARRELVRIQDMVTNANKWAAHFTDGRISVADVRELLSVCIYCGSHEDLTLEHVVPLSRGGANHRSNLALACWPCNQAKRDRTPDEFIHRLSHLPHLRPPSAGAAAPRGYSALGGVDL